MSSPDIDYLLRRGVFEVIIEREMRGLLAEGKPLRLKMGFDPSRADLHLGYAVALRKLRQLQDLGHRVVLIVGDWTARIGDPTGQSVTRPMLTEEEVNANAQTYMRQFFRIVDRSRTEVVFQSEWFGKFGLADVINLTSRFTVAQMLQREDFAQRYGAQKPIALTEFLYPLLQGYDSVAIRSDVEFGGSDQKFNCLVGRELQTMLGQRPQQVFLVPLLVGTDGRKMSQSYGNYIGFEEPPAEMYGKVMSIPDTIMMDYFELLTDVPDAELQAYRAQLAEGTAHPMALKHRLAGEIVAQFHDEEAARAAAEHFRRVVQQKETPEAVPEFRVPADGSVCRYDPDAGDFVLQLPRVLVMADACASVNEARRLIAQGAVEIDGRTAEGVAERLPASGALVRVGKRKFVRLVPGDGAGG